jgi:hypothetical protein
VTSVDLWSQTWQPLGEMPLSMDSLVYRGRAQKEPDPGKVSENMTVPPLQIFASRQIRPPYLHGTGVVVGFEGDETARMWPASRRAEEYHCQFR